MSRASCRRAKSSRIRVSANRRRRPTNTIPGRRPTTKAEWDKTVASHPRANARRDRPVADAPEGAAPPGDPRPNRPRRLHGRESLLRQHAGALCFGQSLSAGQHQRAKSPAVLCPHGHWNGRPLQRRWERRGRWQIGQGAEATMAGARFSAAGADGRTGAARLCRVPLRHGRHTPTASRSCTAKASPMPRRNCGCKACWDCKRSIRSGPSISSRRCPTSIRTASA